MTMNLIGEIQYLLDVLSKSLIDIILLQMLSQKLESIPSDFILLLQMTI